MGKSAENLLFMFKMTMVKDNYALEVDVDYPKSLHNWPF